MTVPFPQPTLALNSRTDVFLTYLDYLRSRVLGKLQVLPTSELRRSRLPSGWTPVELLRHLTYVELRWLQWGFAGEQVDDPWGDERGGRWFVAPDESMSQLAAELHAQAARSRAVIERHDLAELGRPGQRWDGAEPASLERVLFHLVQEYARHLGQLDIISELAGASTGE